mgnify:CR=1 FL=1
MEEGPSGEHVRGKERTYKIDRQGYLLDGNNFYLVDERGERIQVSEERMQKLKQFSVI